MSAPVRHGDTPSMFPMMYAPPWAREAARDAAEAAGATAVDKALNASEELRRTLPPAAPLTAPAAAPAKPVATPPKESVRRLRDPSFDGDLGTRHVRSRASLDPVAVPPPPVRKRRSAVAVFARITGAVGLAALAAFFMVGMPRPLMGAVSDAATAVQPYWSRLMAATRLDTPPHREAARREVPPGPARVVPQDPARLVPRSVTTERVPAPEFQPAAFADRIDAFPTRAETAPVVPAPSIQERTASPAGPQLRVLDRDELNLLIKRSEELIREGDIAAARLMLTRAAEAGDARGALALAATYDPDTLRKLGVVGVGGDAAKARSWYAKAAEFGSGEATRRLETLAQGR